MIIWFPFCRTLCRMLPSLLHLKWGMCASAHIDVMYVCQELQKRCVLVDELALSFIALLFLIQWCSYCIMFAQTEKKKKNRARSKSTAYYPASVLQHFMRRRSCANREAVTQTLEDRQPAVSLLLRTADIQSSGSLATCLPEHYERFAAHPVMTTSRH